MNPPDLSNPWWMVLGWALVLWIAAGIVWHREHRSTRRPGAPRRLARRLRDRLRAAARDRRRLRHLPDEAGSSSGTRPEPGVERHAASVRAEQEHDDARGVRPLPRLDLTDDELVALARYLDHSSRRMSGLAIADALDAIVKVLHAADDVMHEDRASRRA